MHPFTKEKKQRRGIEIWITNTGSRSLPKFLGGRGEQAAKEGEDMREQEGNSMLREGAVLLCKKILKLFIYFLDSEEGTRDTQGLDVRASSGFLGDF